MAEKALIIWKAKVRKTPINMDKSAKIKHHSKNCGAVVWSRVRESNPPPRLGKPL